MAGWRGRPGFRTVLNFVACVLGVVSPCLGAVGRHTMGECVDRQGRAQRCMPEFENAAFNKLVVATNTCGDPPIEYCLQTGVTGVTKSCHMCDSSNPRLTHPPRYLTDFNNDDNTTWWQSETMLQGVQYPNEVNITLSLGKSFDITYVRLKFHTSRPESFAIYKRTTEDGEWIPYQYYSGSCRSTFQKINRGVITNRDETEAICTDEFSDISPLTGGNVAFSTLEGRPSAYNFDNSLTLQDFVTATDIRVTLNRINSFGDEVFRDPKVLKSYYYAISDFAVGGRCKCNGHAASCEANVNTGGGGARLICVCEHNTAGVDCDRCLPMFNDRPWGRATASDSHECQACNCNNLADSCEFDSDLYRRTGHGGRCIGCRQNTAGPNCERCLEYYYRAQQSDPCQPCNCNPLGSIQQQCDPLGRCQCKPGVGGDKCDRCQDGHFGLSEAGCRQCSCDSAGTVNNAGACDQVTGQCQCKQNVEGPRCDRCKPGYFNLDSTNPSGCISCFCYGHSAKCAVASGYAASVISTPFTTAPRYQYGPRFSTFTHGQRGWTGEDRFGNEREIRWTQVGENLGATADSQEPIYFVAPAEYLGNQRLSYGQTLTFKLRVDPEDVRLSAEDIVLEGNGIRLSAAMTAQQNPMPRRVNQEYSFRLHEDPSLGWNQRLTSFDFNRLLSNLTSVKIRGTYTDRGRGFLDDVRLNTAVRSGAQPAASWVEVCECPEGLTGQFCEQVVPGYKQENPQLGPFSPVEQCFCNGHSASCDTVTGECSCQHNTEGIYCERCLKGYYGDATQGTPNDCQPCPCPNQAPCDLAPNGEVVCTSCTEGYIGDRCERCMDGYYGDPIGQYGQPRPCQRCICSGNIDENAVGNCNSITGECLKCVYFTTGTACERCLPGYYGDATSFPKPPCKPCNCYQFGTQAGGECDQNTGQCPCLSNVVGLQCDRCVDGYWNINSGSGCEVCDCDTTGSLDTSCELNSGQCQCKPGVGGRRCEKCLANHYGFSTSGCTACDCDPRGSLSLQCDEFGSCPCREGVVGDKCDACKENYYDVARGCIECPACYGLVQDKVDDHREKLRQLRDLINNVGVNPDLINDQKFEERLKQVEELAKDLLNEARKAAGGAGINADSLREALDALRDKVNEIEKAKNNAQATTNDAKVKVQDADETIRRIQDKLREANNYLGNEGKQALDEAEQAAANFGQGSREMQELAEQAKALANDQTEDAQAIEDTANQALQTSKDALKAVRDALAGQGDIANKRIPDLERKLQDAEEQLDKVNREAADALANAEASADRATKILANAQARQPNIDVDDLKRQTAAIKDEAENSLLPDLAKLEADNRQTVNDINDNYDAAEQLLKDAQDKQDVIDQLLARADAANDKAEQAEEKGRETLGEAQKTLEYLSNFEAKVQESKAKADEALGKEAEIRRIIDEAVSTTDQAEAALGSADSDARTAKKTAEQAKQIAEGAAADAKQVKEDAATIYDQATAVNNNADELKGDVDSAENTFNQKKRQADDDETRVNAAMDAANDAQRKADVAMAKVQGTLDRVNKILEQLDQIDPPDAGKLTELQKEYDDLKAELDALRINQLILNIQRLMTEQENTVTNFEAELDTLKKEVANLEDISRSLPDGCFKQEGLEDT
ncbi:laminin subunit gamma-1-like isoform X3 [Branchiostoma floridae]|uniref:Laminin subunit gamma-1-like isoform X3 n=1 Tax=Branchiostoma floridae TaxID=7739 RepID=A0A9J7MZY0_BRAFL|nr:laminin subunit gamma-1-like isoform X3 [Branchiostoma floridae]